MRKFLCMLMALVLAAAGMPAAAEEAQTEGTLSGVMDAVERLMFEETNVTVEGEAQLYIGDEPLSQVTGWVLQDGTDSYQQFSVTHGSGEDAAEGYAVLGYGNRAYFKTFRAGKELPGYERTFPSKTILRRRADQEQMFALFRAAAKRMDERLADRIQVKTGEDGAAVTTVEAGEEELSGTVNLTVNFVWQYAVKSYPELEYITHGMDENSYWMYLDSEGIEAAADADKSIQLENVRAEIATDAENRLSSVSGEVRARLTNESELRVEFTLKVSDYGSTNVRETEWINDAMKAAVAEGERERIRRGGEDAGTDIDLLTAMNDTSGHLTTKNIETSLEAVAFAEEFWAKEFVGSLDITDNAQRVTFMEESSAWQVETEIGGENEPILTLIVGKDGWVREFINNESGVNEAVETSWNLVMGEDDDEAIEYRGELFGWAIDQLNQVDEGLTGEYGSLLQEISGDGMTLLYAGTLQNEDGNVFVTGFSEPDEEKTHRLKFIIQIQPVRRVVYYNEWNDPTEGGNG